MNTQLNENGKLTCRAGRGRGEGWSPIVVQTKLQYTSKEKRAAQIIDQLCPVFTNETKTHIGPKCFRALVLRLTELL